MYVYVLCFIRMYKGALFRFFFYPFKTALHLLFFRPLSSLVLCVVLKSLLENLLQNCAKSYTVHLLMIKHLKCYRLNSALKYNMQDFSECVSTSLIFINIQMCGCISLCMEYIKESLEE